MSCPGCLSIGKCVACGATGHDCNAHGQVGPGPALWWSLADAVAALVRAGASLDEIRAAVVDAEVIHE